MEYKFEIAWLRAMAMLNRTIAVYEQDNCLKEANNLHIKAAYAQVKAIKHTMENIEKELGL